MFSPREAEMEGGIVFATKKLHADWTAFLTDFWALKAGFPGHKHIFTYLKLSLQSRDWNW